MGSVAGAGGLSDGSPVRIRPPACCAAHRRCSQRRSARRSSWLIVAAATVATAWSWPSQRTHAALLILPRAADRRCSGRAWWRQTARAWWISRATCSCAGAPRRHLIAWLRLLSIDLQLDGDVLAWAGGEARSQAADGADGRRHGPRGHDCGGSSAELRGSGAAGGSSGSGSDGRIRSAGDGARLAVAACCASAEFHDRAAACANSPILRG